MECTEACVGDCVCAGVNVCVCVGERVHVHAHVNSVLVTGVSYAREGKAVIALSAVLRLTDLIPAPLG